MKRKHIEVDEEVHARLQAEAAERLETPNTVLRRLLGLDEVWLASNRSESMRSMDASRLELSDRSSADSSFFKLPSAPSASREEPRSSAIWKEQSAAFDHSQDPTGALPLPSLPHHISTTLEHTLQMIHLVRAHGYTRIEATKALAEWHRVAIPTITIKFTRQLGISAHEIDALLEPGRLGDLADLLAGRFPDYEPVIREVVEG